MSYVYLHTCTLVPIHAYIHTYVTNICINTHTQTHRQVIYIYTCIHIHTYTDILYYMYTNPIITVYEGNTGE